MAEQLPLLAGPSRDAARADVLRGLTLWQPWAYAVTHLGKRIENRPWAPWRSVVGKRVALHAAKGTGSAEDYERAVSFILRTTGVDVRAAEHQQVIRAQMGNLVAMMRVAGAVSASTDPWFFGPYGWVLEEVQILPAPILHRGYQGLWPVTADVASAVRAALEGGTDGQR